MIKQAYSKLVLPPQVREIVTLCNSITSEASMKNVIDVLTTALINHEIARGLSMADAESNAGVMLSVSALAQADNAGYGHHWFFLDPGGA